MMHAREKSDLAIVAGKPANNVEPLTAEPAEPRAGTKRNAGEQSTHRTQGRARVTQALARVAAPSIDWDKSAGREPKKPKLGRKLHAIPVRSRLILRSPSSGDSWPNMQSIWNAKAASVGNSSLAKAFLAPCRINPDAGAARSIHYCEAGAVAFRDLFSIGRTTGFFM